ncbi:hypothetical protein L3Q67_35880 [Saccharothrix sp. AJ9571]|nr:hypothetical protein L3Q67_35880 [Saccharothrix sp. AJ9571]
MNKELTYNRQYSVRAEAETADGLDTGGLTLDNRFHVGVADATGELPAGQLSTPVMVHGSLMVRLYQPRGEDAESRHDRDELYVILQGSGLLFHGAHSRGDTPYQRFQRGDVLFVPAYVVHRLLDLSEDCLMWTIRYGPPGGEAKADSPVSPRNGHGPDDA